MLFPLPEPLFLQFDLFRKPLSQQFLLLLELWIINLFDLWFSEFSSFHLSLSVSFIMCFFRRSDEIEHVDAKEESSKFLEVAVFFVFDYKKKDFAIVSDKPGIGDAVQRYSTWLSLTLGHTPQVLPSLDHPSISRLDIIRTSDDRERHRFL